MRVRANGRQHRPTWLLVVPATAMLISIHYAPQIAASFYAFTDWNGVSADATWVGFGNFREIFTDPSTRGALVHTITLAVVFVIVVNLVGLGLALGLNRTVKTRIALRAAFFLPVVLSSLALGFVWRFLFAYDGLLNSALGGIGLSSWQRVWLGDPTWALWTILVVLVWQYSGLAMVLYLAGLQSVPDEIMESAAVDTAGNWLTFRRITLPMLAPSITASVTLTTIFGLRVFDQVLALTGGGPVDATETLATQVYEQTFVAGRFGYGSALALVLAALVGLLGVAQALLLRRGERRLA